LLVRIAHTAANRLSIAPSGPPATHIGWFKSSHWTARTRGALPFHPCIAGRRIVLAVRAVPLLESLIDLGYNTNDLAHPYYCELYLA
jgi:hypothetical protein